MSDDKTPVAPAEKKEEQKPEAPQAPPPNMAAPKMRRIIIETDGNGVKIVSAEVGGSLELRAILGILLESLNRK